MTNRVRPPLVHKRGFCCLFFSCWSHVFSILSLQSCFVQQNEEASVELTVSSCQSQPHWLTGLFLFPCLCNGAVWDGWFDRENPELWNISLAPAVWTRNFFINSHFSLYFRHFQLMFVGWKIKSMNKLLNKEMFFIRKVSSGLSVLLHPVSTNPFFLFFRFQSRALCTWNPSCQKKNVFPILFFYWENICQMLAAFWHMISNDAKWPHGPMHWKVKQGCPDQPLTQRSFRRSCSRQGFIDKGHWKGHPPSLFSCIQLKLQQLNQFPVFLMGTLICSLIGMWLKCTSSKHHTANCVVSSSEPVVFPVDRSCPLT